MNKENTMTAEEILQKQSASKSDGEWYYHELNAIAAMEEYALLKTGELTAKMEKLQDANEATSEYEAKYEEALKIIQQNFKGLSKLIDDPTLVEFYTRVAAECMAQFWEANCLRENKPSPTSPDHTSLEKDNLEN